MFNNLLAYIGQLFNQNDKYVYLNLYIPSEIVLRTKLICNYISQEENCDFDIQSLIYLLYADFIKNAVEHYNPKKVFEKLTKNYINEQKLIITNGYEKVIIASKISYYKIEIEFDKEEATNGQLILNEIEELFHKRISFNSLISQLWISFISDYKTGKNAQAFNYIKKILKKHI